MRGLAFMVLFVASSASGQDMPPRDWTKAGEGWRKADGAKPERKEIALSVTVPGLEPTASAVGGDTLYVGIGDRKHLWTFPIKDGKPGTGQPYASLRCPVATKLPIAVSSLAADAAGRIYAATPLGVQVFDPTGRLSGVLPPPAKGEMKLLGWEKDELVVWIGDQKYVRKMNATGK